MRYALLGLVAAVSASACADVFGPDRGTVNLVMQPRFAQYDESLDGEDPALRVDNIRVVIVNEAGDTVVDQVVEWPLDQDTLRVEVAIEVSGEESFDFELQGREGNTVLFQARQQLALSADEPSPAPSQPVLEYAGPEAALESIAVEGAATAFTAGGQVQLTAVGTAEDGSEIQDPLMVWASLDTLAATVDSTGVVRVKHDGARTVGIVGRVAFRTLADTLALPIVPDTMVFVRAPDTIPAFGWEYVIRGVPLGATGDTVRNVEIDWTVRNGAVLEQTATYDLGIQGSMVSRANGASWVVAELGPFIDSVHVVVDQVTTAAAPSPTHAVVGVGESVQLAIVPLDANGYPVENAPAPVWTSADAGIATVDAGGLATGASAPAEIAAARVTGEVEGQTYNAWVEVRDDINTGAPLSLSVGDGHSCWIDGIRSWIYCRGTGQLGQLGDGSRIDRDTTVLAFNAHQTPGDTHTAVSAGGLHSCALMDTVGGARAFCWGNNSFGQLGDGTVTDRLQPTPISDGAVAGTLTSVVAGGGHSCALDDTGAAYCWGSNYFGQLGSGSAATESLTPVAVTGGHTFTQLAAGWIHTCGLATDGTVWCWGRGEEGELGDGALAEARSPVQVSGGQTYTALATGAAHTCGITSAGGLECWGYNSAGQAGTGDPGFEVATPTAVPFPTAVNVIDVALGWVHGCALADTGQLYCWGGNDQLQLGQALPRVTRTPIPAPALGFTPNALAGGGSETCATDGSALACWGGIDPDYLGREQVAIPPSSADPLAAFSGR
jgi:alpha-tubulin suppressor-like RCC1 family protein